MPDFLSLFYEKKCKKLVVILAKINFIINKNLNLRDFFCFYILFYPAFLLFFLIYKVFS